MWQNNPRRFICALNPSRKQTHIKVSISLSASLKNSSLHLMRSDLAQKTQAGRLSQKKRHVPNKLRHQSRHYGFRYMSQLFLKVNTTPTLTFSSSYPPQIKTVPKSSLDHNPLRKIKNHILIWREQQVISKRKHATLICSKNHFKKSTKQLTRTQLLSRAKVESHPARYRKSKKKLVTPIANFQAFNRPASEEKLLWTQLRRSIIYYTAATITNHLQV